MLISHYTQPSLNRRAVAAGSIAIASKAGAIAKTAGIKGFGGLALGGGAAAAVISTGANEDSPQPTAAVPPPRLPPKAL